MKDISLEVDFRKDMLLQLKELEEKAGIKLGMKERLLLAERGTVEQILSILFNEPVTIEVTKQIEKIEMNTIEREVSIMLKDKEIIRASSIIYTKYLPEDLLDDIRAKKLGIGTIINKYSLETFRKIIEVGYANRMIYRVYEIIYRGKTAFRIREEILP